MLFQRTIGDICGTSKSCEEIRNKLKEKHIPFEEHERGKYPTHDVVNGKESEEPTGMVAFTIDLGKVDESYYAKDYYGYIIIEKYGEPYSKFYYSKIET